MKTTVLNVVAREAGVTVLALARVEVPLASLAGRPLGALECVRLDPAALGVPLPSHDPRIDLVPLHLKGLTRRTFGRRGIVVGTSIAQALEFILANWNPIGKHEPDVTLRAVQAERVPRHVRISELEVALIGSQDEDAEPFGARIRPRKARLKPKFVWTQAEFESTFEAVTADGRTAFLPSAGTFIGESKPPRHAAVIEHCQIVEGHRVPRWDVLTVSSAENVEAVAWGFQNGRWFRCPFSRLDARVLEIFEEQGRLVSVTEGDLLASETLDAQFLLRVPEGRAPADPERAGDVPPPLRALPGALLWDSRNPIRIPDDLQVITDPREAWSVLLRTTSGIFLPDASPCTPPRSFAKLAGAWIVGGIPAGRVP